MKAYNFKGWDVSVSDNGATTASYKSVTGIVITHKWDNESGCRGYLSAISDNEEHFNQFLHLTNK